MLSNGGSLIASPKYRTNFEVHSSDKAGPAGQFAQSLMTDPVAMQNLSSWQGRFMQSNQGAAFNQARAQQGIGRALGGAA